jgi:hypothetical protein
MTRILIAALLLSPIAAHAKSAAPASPAAAMPAARALALKAGALGQDSRDQALAALYNRLFALQDMKSEAELAVDFAEIEIDDAAKAYKRLDRWMDKEKLKEVALDPDHRDYPRITESRKLELVETVWRALREQQKANLKIARYDRQIADVERLIEKHLASRGGN